MNSRRTFLKKSAIAGFVGLSGGLLFRNNCFAIPQKVRKYKNVTLAEAWELHKRCIIIDGHTDTPVERMTARKEIPMLWMERNTSYQQDIPRTMDAGQQYTGFMIISAGRGKSPDAYRNFAEMERQFKKYQNEIRKVLISKDIREAAEKRKMGVINGIEGCWGPLDGNIANLERFHEFGLRLAGISHGEGGSDTKYLQGTWSINKMITPADREMEYKKAAGLTPFGLEVLKFSNEHNIITDLSHINDKAYFEVLEKSSTIPIVSHTAVYSLCQQGRCLTDDQIKAIAQKGGVIGITFVPEFIDNDPEQADIEKLIDHVCYVVDMVGIDHIGIGSDYDGGVPHPVIPEVSLLIELTRGLMSRGFSEEEIKKIWGENFLRIIEKVMDV